MLIVGAIAVLYSFCYCTGALAELGQAINITSGESYFQAAEGKNDALLFKDIQGFNNILMICGIVMVLLAVILYITACNKRRNYYISNYVATGVCAGGNIIISIVLMVMNAMWRGKFLNVDFDSWMKYYKNMQAIFGEDAFPMHYSESTLWFDIGFAVYILVILASIALILNLVWKIKLMQGEKQLLNGKATVTGGAV